MFIVVLGVIPELLYTGAAETVTNVYLADLVFLADGQDTERERERKVAIVVVENDILSCPRSWVKFDPHAKQDSTDLAWWWVNGARSPN